MSCQMESEILLNATDVGYLFQISISFLIAENWQQYAVQKRIFIFSQDSLCGWKKRHVDWSWFSVDE